jgi:hypothetical protein
LASTGPVELEDVQEQPPRFEVEEEADARTCTLGLRAEDEVAAAAATLEVVHARARSALLPLSESSSKIRSSDGHIDKSPVDFFLPVNQSE